MRQILLLLLLSFSSSLLWAKGMVVSIHPIYLIAQEVTKGIEQPELLLTPQQSGHDIQLTPKARQAMQNADLVIWLGEQHEAPLKNALTNQKNSVALLNHHIIKTLPQRDEKGKAIAGSIDTHVWLEPNNAIRIAFFIAALRSQQQPQHQIQYWQNARNFAKAMQQAAAEADKNNKPQSYWAYHDAYQYLERAMNLHFAGALTVDHDLAPTAAQLKYLNDHRPNGKMCLLVEAHAHHGAMQKLNPVQTVAVDEAMSKEQNFIAGWKHLNHAIQQCFR